MVGLPATLPPVSPLWGCLPVSHMDMCVSLFECTFLLSCVFVFGSTCACVCACVCLRERVSVCVCVCV